MSFLLLHGIVHQFLLMKPGWASFYCWANWESYPSAISALLDQSQPKKSRHLALLRESGLLLDRKKRYVGSLPLITAYSSIFGENYCCGLAMCHRKRFRRLSAHLARQNCSGDSKNICS
uniref:ArsR n=1 Tax=Stutzerimonas stutzeri TaxID=316 RepID=Q68GK3_STUST|nr:ArsR [Stutzerimonas stutzeri]